MNSERIPKTMLLLLAAGAALFMSQRAGATEPNPSLLFDMGLPHSPLQNGYVRIAAEELYGPARGYGFLEKGHKGFALEAPKEWNRHQVPLDEHFAEHGTPLRVDGVRDTRDIRFRADVPPGTYRVTVSLGDLLTPMGSVSLLANGRLIRQNLSFRHGLYRYIAGAQFEHKGSRGVTGFYRSIRFTVEAPNGFIEIHCQGDESEYNRLLAEETKRGMPPGRLSFQKDAKFSWKDGFWTDIGETFVDIPLLGVEIRPYSEPRVRQRNAGVLTYTGESKAIRSAVEAYNQQDFSKAEWALDAGEEDDDPLDAALAYMWLAGHPNYEEESRIAPKARLLLEKALAKDPDNAIALESLEQLQAFQKGLDRHLNRGLFKRNHFIENMRASNLFQLAQFGDPLFWKSRHYAARIGYMLDPIQRELSSGTGYLWMKEIYDNFPDNRHAKYYVTGKYDKTDLPWRVPDYTEKVKDAPEWAKELYVLYNLQLDLGEWWFTHKQREDGGIGGGWGDDVESAAWLGLPAMLSEGASPKNIAGLAKIGLGVFMNSGQIDPDTGFIYMQTDSEHATEWTGDTLPLMMAAEFGNPYWIERAFCSARLMRDLWTGINPRGHRHFRNLYMGGMSMGTDPQDAAEDAYSWRGCFPVERIYWYNQHPEVRRLLLEWSTSWLEDALGTQAGKPAGFIPNIIGYDDCKPGGPKREDWGRFGGAGTHGYGINIILTGYLITGDEKYLEPLRLEARENERLGDIPKDKKAQWDPRKTNEIPGYIKYVTNQSVETLRLLEPPSDGRYKPLYSYGEIADLLKGRSQELRDRWPFWTTEASATDRVGTYQLMDEPLRIMSGGGLGKTSSLYAQSVSYQGIGRDLAAFVTGNYLNRLTLAIYAFRDGMIDIAVRPWDLQVGCTYRLTVAPDADQDFVPDAPGQTALHFLEGRGKPVPFRIEGRKTYIVTLEMEGQPQKPNPKPDLSVWEGDIELLKEYHGTYATVVVHNTGTADAEEFKVALYEGSPESGIKIGEQLVSRLGWPRDLRPQTIKIGWRYEPSSPKAFFTVVVDPDNSVKEITEENNSATRYVQ